MLSFRFNSSLCTEFSVWGESLQPRMSYNNSQILLAAQVVSMLREPKLKVFYSPPSHDLRLNFDQEEERDRMEYQRPWPDLENLFGDDLEYQKYLTDIGSYMALQLEQVKQFSHVSGYTVVF